MVNTIKRILAVLALLSAAVFVAAVVVLLWQEKPLEKLFYEKSKKKLV